ncbi:MAG TPA: sugar ABC transporter substrate-binding protein [Chloroflexota bacterium]|nr:sugar ABC transporter substrate-binding protein [Chloroflexota bacterium]
MEPRGNKTRASTRRVVLGGAAGLTGALLAACGGAAPAAQIDTKNRAPVTIRSWIGEPNNERFPATQAADTAIKAKYPHINIQHEVKPAGSQIEMTVAGAAANTLPDLIIAQGTASMSFATKGISIPLDPYLAKTKDFDLKDFPEVGLTLYQYEKKQHYIPYDHAPIMLYYNKEMFERFGVKPPDSTWTMDTLIETAKKMHRPQEGIWGMAGFTPAGGFTTNGSYMAPWGGVLLNDTETETQIDSRESLQSLEFWANTRLRDKINPLPADGNARTLFTTGKAAMHDAGMWAYRDIVVAKNRMELPFTPDIADWPKGPKTRATSSMGSGYGITKDSKAPEDAWLYLSEYVGKDLERSIMGQFLKTGYGIPVRYSLMQKWETLKDFAPANAKIIQPAMKTYAVMGRPISPAKADFDKLFNDHFNPVWEGKASVGDAVKEIKRLSGPILAINQQYVKK